MQISKRDLVDMTAKLQMDLRDAQAKLTELRAWIAQLDIPNPEVVTCPSPGCGFEFHSANRLAEHVYTIHGGPEPTHYRDAEEHAAST